MSGLRKEYEKSTGAGLRGSEPRSRRIFGLASTSVALLIGAGCAVFATRPVQEMSDTSAAIRAAREVQAETLAPELFRQASELYQTAKNQYKMKNFEAAKEAADKSRRYAELAEFEALKGTGVRAEVNIPDPVADTNALPGQGDLPPPPPPAPEPSPYVYPTPTGTPFSEYDKRKAEEDEAARKKAEEEKKAAQPSPTPGFIPYPVYPTPGGPTLQNP